MCNTLPLTVKLRPPPPSQQRVRQTVKLKPRTLENPSLDSESTAVFKSQVNIAKIAEDIRKDIENQIEPLVPNEAVDTNCLKMEEPQQPSSASAEKIKCPECGKMFKGTSAMFNHYKLRHGEKSFQCPICGMKYPSKNNVTRHIRNKHQNIKYPCDQCEYQATTQGDAKKHRDGKHSNLILSCDSCYFQTKWRAEYRRHMKTHDSPELE